MSIRNIEDKVRHMIEKRGGSITRQELLESATEWHFPEGLGIDQVLRVLSAYGVIEDAAADTLVEHPNHRRIREEREEKERRSKLPGKVTTGGKKPE